MDTKHKGVYFSSCDIIKSRGITSQGYEEAGGGRGYTFTQVRENNERNVGMDEVKVHSYTYETQTSLSLHNYV